MSAIDPDRRQTKTRQAIRQAFIELLFQLHYKDVTVAAVAERANVGRSTLYEHFRTKSDLLKDSLTVPFSLLASVVGSEHIPDQFIWLLQHFRENQALGRVLFYLPANALMLRVLAGLIETRLVTMAGDAPPRIPLSLIAAQIAAAQFALLTPWILGQVALSQSALAQALHLSSNAMARSLLGAPAFPQAVNLS